MAFLSLKQPDGAVRTYELTSDVTTVGRHPDNLLVLDEGTASSRHAEIVIQDGDYAVRDLDSANGTFLNGTRVEKSDLKDGDIVHFAGAEAVFHSKLESRSAKSEKSEKSETSTVAEEDSPRSFASKLMGFGKSKRTRESGERSEKPVQFVHTVFFWLKDDLNEKQIQTFEEGLASLSHIGSVTSFHFGKPAGTDRPVIDRSYSYGLTVIFKDKEHHDKYQDDSIHHKFINECDHMWTRIQVFDFA